MFKNALSVILLSSCMTTTVFASNIFQLLDIPYKKTHSQQRALNNTNPTHAGDYTDFSGRWEGSCDGGKTVKLNIKNDADHLEINKEAFVINGLQGESSHEAWGAYADYLSVNWNAEKNALILSSAGVDKSNAISSLITDIAQITFTLNDNNQLTIESKLKVFENYSQLDKEYNSSCTFTKVNK